MGFLSKLFGRSQVPWLQQIVEQVVTMRFIDRSSWDEIRQFLDGAFAVVNLDSNEQNRTWLEVQEKCRIAISVGFFNIAREKYGLTQDAATEFSIRWTNLTNFWFSDVDRPGDKTTHLLRLDSEPEVEIDLLFAEIERQDPRVIPHLKEMRKADPEIGLTLRILRRKQIEDKPTSEMNACWDRMIFSSLDKLNLSIPK